MGLDTRYIPSKYFQEGILDKDTGCPLAAGIVKFYKDTARTEPKEMFKLSGSPPNYTYASLGTEITLSGIGTIDDGLGNDVIPYFFPYDSSGNLELYYFTVESAGAIGQFTREGVPNLSDTDVDAADVNNYIPNGQFLLHHNLVESTTPPRETGQIIVGTTVVAEGGWLFERSSASTAKDFVFFDRFDSYVTTPSASPRYAIRVKNEIPDASDTIKRLVIVFKDVNKFATTTGYYTFAFMGKSDSGSPANVDIQLLKNYGSGGSLEDIVTLQTVTLPTSYKAFNISFIPGDNSGKTIGSNDDDTISIAIDLPKSFGFENSFDNFVLTDGNVTINNFPPTTDGKFKRDSLAGLIPVPEYEGQNLGLPLILGINGFEYDTATIGNYRLKSTDILGTRELWADDNEYLTSDYINNIPLRRLYDKWSSLSPFGLSIYGVGLTQLEMVPNFPLPTNNYQLKTVAPGAPTPAADGAVPTGFTFTPVSPNPYAVDIITVAASGMTAGCYFTYHNLNAQKIIPWYEIDGSGTQPVEVAIVYQKVVLIGTDDAATVAIKTAIAINSLTVHIPDWRGYFIRITDDMGIGVAGRDPDAATRSDRGDGLTGNHVGTTQLFAVEDHRHSVFQLTGGGTIETGGSGDQDLISQTGLVKAPAKSSTETRSINRYANMVILI